MNSAPRKPRFLGLFMVATLGIISQVAFAVPYTLTTMNDPNGAKGTLFYGINDSGVGVGNYTDSSFSFHNFIETGGTFSGVTGPAGAASFTVYGINNSGQIVGEFGDPGPTITHHGFVGSGTTFTTIDVPGIVGETVARAVSSTGVVVGYYFNGDGTASGFSESAGTFKTFHISNAFNTFVVGINSSGLIVGGFSTIGDGFGRHGFLYDGVNFTTIDDPNGIDDTDALGINDAGQIVGDYTDSTGVIHGFVDTGGIFTDLDGPNAVETFARSISNNGQIAGNYSGSGNSSGFIAVPVPEPAGCAVLLVAFSVASSARPARKNQNTPVNYSPIIVGGFEDRRGAAASLIEV